MTPRFCGSGMAVKVCTRHLPARGRRALVVSPFVRKSFLEDILNRCDQAIIVSTQRELDAIADNAFMSRVCGAKNRVYVVTPADSNDGGTAMDLHAKLLIFEDVNGPMTFLGSANASNSAWEGRNCEALVRFAPGVSIVHFCDRFIFSDEQGKRGGRRPLRGWTTSTSGNLMSRTSRITPNGISTKSASAISRLDLRADYDPDKRHLKVALETVSPDLRVSFSAWTSTCEVQVALLSQFHSNAALKPFGPAHGR